MFRTDFVVRGQGQRKCFELLFRFFFLPLAFGFRQLLFFFLSLVARLFALGFFCLPFLVDQILLALAVIGRKIVGSVAGCKRCLVGTVVLQRPAAAGTEQRGQQYAGAGGGQWFERAMWLCLMIMCLSQGEAVVRQRLSGRMAMGLMTVEGKQGEGDASCLVRHFRQRRKWQFARHAGRANVCANDTSAGRPHARIQRRQPADVE